MRKYIKYIERVVLAVFVCGLVHYGSTKHIGKVRVYDDYIRDNGSYLTNDYVYVAITKTLSIVPDSANVLVYAREISSTNAADWLQLTPVRTIGEHPCTYMLIDATNYNIAVMCDFVPPPIVHTNGVLTIKGFIIPGTDKIAFPRSQIKEIE